MFKSLGDHKCSLGVSPRWTVLLRGVVPRPKILSVSRHRPRGGWGIGHGYIWRIAEWAGGSERGLQAAEPRGEDGVSVPRPPDPDEPHHGGRGVLPGGPGHHG